MAGKSEVKKLEDKIAKETKDRDDLNKAIRDDTAKLQKARRKERDARLVQWGIALEQALSDPESDFTERGLANLCQKYLSGRSLSRALTGPFEKFADQSENEGTDESKQSSQQWPQDQQSQWQGAQQANRPRQSE